MSGPDRTASNATRRPAWTASLNLPLSVFELCVLAAFCALYLISRRAYGTVIDLWSFHPFRYPFLDAEYVSAQIECWRQGIDVYLINPCDVLGRRQNLSPLWLRLPFWPADKSWTNVLGLSIDTAFIASLAVLPRARLTRDAIPIFLALISTDVVFALERANEDVIIFTLIACAIVLLERSFVARLLGYAVILIGAFLKFYPLVLLIALLRENLRIMFALTVVAVAACLVFVWALAGELPAALANIASPGPESFGAIRLPSAVPALAANISPAFGTDLEVGDLPRLVAFVILTVSAGAIAVRLLTFPGFGAPSGKLTTRESLCLLFGATLICGCFFAGRNNMYRAIYFLLVLPGLFSWAREASSPAVARLIRGTGWIALLLMFDMPAQRAADHVFGPTWHLKGPTGNLIYWVCNELLWWWVVAVLLGVLLRFVFTSLAMRSLLRLT